VGNYSWLSDVFHVRKYVYLASSGKVRVYLIGRDAKEKNVKYFVV
jgi:hypothetical protein